MILYLGNGISADLKTVVAVMDIEKASTAKNTREYLALTGKAGRVVYCTYDIPKSFVVTLDRDFTEKVYVSSVTVGTLKKRIEKYSFGRHKG